MRALVWLTLAAAGTAPLQPTELLQWPRMRADRFGCMLEKRFGIKLETYNCTAPKPPTGDPCVDTGPYYDGPKLPEQLASSVQGAGAVERLSADWEHGQLRSLTVTLKGKRKVQDVERMFKVTFPKDAKLNSPRGHPNIQSISVQLIANADRQIELGGAPPASQRHVHDMGKLRTELVDYAIAGRLAETVTALATVSGLPADTIRRLLTQQEHDALLIICKANGLGWLTVRAVLELSAGTKGNAGVDSAGYLDQYTRMSRESAERVIRFLKVRKSASPTDLKKMMAS